MSQLSKEAFLVFSGFNQRAVIALCRQLTLMKIQFYIVAVNKNDAVYFSTYSKNIRGVRSQDALDLNEIKEIISSIKNETGSETLTIAPSSEYLNHFLLKNRKELEAIGCRIPLVEKELYDLITNKYSFSCLCREFGISIPAPIEFENKFSFPFVAKPKKNINESGKSLYPYIITNDSDIIRFLKTENKGDFYFEEFIQGESYYLLLHLGKNKTVASYSQKNILQQAEGKSIILAEPSEIHTCNNAVKIIEMLQKMSFYGLIMIEVRKVENELCVIEANPRLWGPLQLLSDNSSSILSDYLKDSLKLHSNLSSNIIELKKNNYFWFNGFIEMIVKKKKIANLTLNKSILLLVMQNIMNDIYLRKDSFKLFFHEFRGIVRG